MRKCIASKLFHLIAVRMASLVIVAKLPATESCLNANFSILFDSNFEFLIQPFICVFLLEIIL